ncbi:MAG TPA: hypothetical protein VHO69_16765 [Phototrophicaceae bacterium]|nr:hypothetical protein [Phototrophicaceae bacterium]
MDLDSVSNKQLQELERLAQELLLVLRKAKLKDLPLIEELNQLVLESGKARRERFDAENTEYLGY